MARSRPPAFMTAWPSWADSQDRRSWRVEWWMDVEAGRGLTQTGLVEHRLESVDHPGAGGQHLLQAEHLGGGACLLWCDPLGEIGKGAQIVVHHQGGAGAVRAVGQPQRDPGSLQGDRQLRRLPRDGRPGPQVRWEDRRSGNQGDGVVADPGGARFRRSGEERDHDGRGADESEPGGSIETVGIGAAGVAGDPHCGVGGTMGGVRCERRDGAGR